MLWQGPVRRSEQVPETRSQWHLRENFQERLTQARVAMPRRRRRCDVHKSYPPMSSPSQADDQDNKQHEDTPDAQASGCQSPPPRCTRSTVESATMCHRQWDPPGQPQVPLHRCFPWVSSFARGGRMRETLFPSCIFPGAEADEGFAVLYMLNLLSLSPPHQGSCLYHCAHPGASPLRKP